MISSLFFSSKLHHCYRFDGLLFPRYDDFDGEDDFNREHQFLRWNILLHDKIQWSRILLKHKWVKFHVGWCFDQEIVERLWPAWKVNFPVIFFFGSKFWFVTLLFNMSPSFEYFEGELSELIKLSTIMWIKIQLYKKKYTFSSSVMSVCADVSLV